MSTTKYLSDGFNGNYPLYSSPYNCNNSTGTTICAISIYSKVARQYTLQDFFDVWGVPLGPSQTLSTTYTSNSTSGGDYLWTMCTSPLSNGAAPSGGWTITNDWGSHVLTGNEVILLDFSDPNYTCTAPGTGSACASAWGRRAPRRSDHLRGPGAGAGLAGEGRTR